MRARGSKVTDIVILVIAADDGANLKPLRPNMLKLYVPIIVAINKSDLSNSQTGKIKDELMRYELVQKVWVKRYLLKFQLK